MTDPDDFEEVILTKGSWVHMDEAPKDQIIEVFCPSKHGLPAMLSYVKWHPDAGFAVDELREPTMWRYNSNV